MRHYFVRSLAFPIAIAALLLLATPLVLAQTVPPTSIFQLDGNADQTANTTCNYGSGPVPCDYWDLINLTGSSGTGRGHSNVNTFILGSTTTDSFQGGGSKDPLLLSQWAYSSTPTPNKDTLNAGYAAAYIQNNHLVVIFGADRLSPNGDANIGIWFFQQDIKLNGTGGFTGAHVNGDVFVVSSFTNGGGKSNIAVYAWSQPGLPNALGGGCTKASSNNPQPGTCAAANLFLLANQTGTGVCDGTGYCAITNSSPTHATWASYSGNTIASPLFFEGGVDITAAFQQFGGNAPCFASFLEETRSSQSPSAVLKDFLLGDFPVCGISATKSCTQAAPNADGTGFNYTVGGIVTNTGIGTLYGVNVTDTIAAPVSAVHPNLAVSNNVSGSPNFGTNTLAAGETGTWTDSYSSTASSVGDSAIATGYTDQGLTTPVTSSSASATCAANASSSLSITKSCRTSLTTTAAVLVSFGGQVCNNGTSQLTGVNLRDYGNSSNLSGTGTALNTNLTLAPGACHSYAGSYLPTQYDSIVDGGDGPGRYFFNDLIVITSATATIGSQPQPVSSPDPRINGTFGSANASCPLCAAGECVLIP